MTQGDHVMYVPGAKARALIVHVFKDNGGGSLDVQTPDGGIESAIPHREPTGGVYNPEVEDLGRTWHNCKHA